MDEEELPNWANTFVKILTEEIVKALEKKGIK